MRVAVGRAAVRRPAGVADAGAAVGAAGAPRGRRRAPASLPARFARLDDAVVVDDGDARRVVAAVFEAAKAAHEHVEAVALSDVSDDSTHAANSTVAASLSARPAAVPRATPDTRLARCRIRRARRRTSRRSRPSSSSAGRDWAALAPSMPSAAPRDRDRAAARPRRAPRPARGRRGLPAAQPAAQPLRRRHEVAARRHERVPARARRVDAVRDRRRRLGRGRQVDDRAPAAGAARPLGAHAPGRAGHHRRLPLPERRARAARPDGRARDSPSPTTAGRCSAS